MGGEDTRGWPEWWGWELGFTAHLEERMLMRGISEVDLRTMLEIASDMKPARRSGRWLVSTRHAGKAWQVVVEPDGDSRKLMVVTAFRVGI